MKKADQESTIATQAAIQPEILMAVHSFLQRVPTQNAQEAQTLLQCINVVRSACESPALDDAYGAEPYCEKVAAACEKVEKDPNEDDTKEEKTLGVAAQV